MSVYHYFANKSEILDGIVDVVFSEIDLPPGDGDWRPTYVAAPTRLAGCWVSTHGRSA